MRSLHKVLDIIDTVAEVGAVGIRELSAQTGFPPATTHRIVSTLLKRRYFKQDPVTKTYSLSLRFLELGQRVQQSFNLSSIARPYLERLMKETKENANIAVQDGDEAVYLDQVRSDHMLQLFTKLGARVPLYATGVGKMFLSQWADADVQAYLERTLLVPHTLHTIVDKGEFLEELKLIRLQGYSIDDEEMEEGVRCAAALVYDHKGLPVAAVSISGAAMRLTRECIANYGEMVKDCALLISQGLGFNSNSKQIS